MKKYLLIIAVIIPFVGCTTQTEEGEIKETAQELLATDANNMNCNSNCLKNSLDVSVQAFVRIDGGELRGAGTKMENGDYASYLHAREGALNFGGYPAENELEIILRSETPPINSRGVKGAAFAFENLTPAASYRYQTTEYENGEYEIRVNLDVNDSHQHKLLHVDGHICDPIDPECE